MILSLVKCDMSEYKDEVALVPFQYLSCFRESAGLDRSLERRLAGVIPACA